MKLIRGKYRSRKSMKKALHLKQSDTDGHAMDTGVINTMQTLVKKFRSAFGVSKHRSARVRRFNARQKGKG